MKSIDPAPHEFWANLLFDEHELDPFFALDRTVKDHDGSGLEAFTDDGERWRARLSYQESNIVNPGSETQQGTRFDLETIREYRLKVERHPEEDPTGQQSFTAHIAPRWDGMKGERNDGTTTEISVPDGFEGINARMKGSNISFRRYHLLLTKAFAVFGIDTRYVRDPHPMSNIQDGELYVRLDDDLSGPVHARDGPIAQMGHLLESDRRGYRKVVQDDDDDHDRNLPGYYHTVTLGPRRVREAFPSHSRAKEIKHYYAREALSKPDDHPLRHPKVGVSLQASRMDGTVYWDDLADLEHELEQALLSVLADAGIDLAPEHGDGPYVEDPYFPVEISRDGPDPVSLDLTELKQEQEHIVVRHLADGFSPCQEEALETLVTDGGEISPADIADDNGRHVESVRRALRGLDDLVDRGYAKVELRSEYVADLVSTAVNEARESVNRALEATAKAERAAERGLDETMSAFVAWASRHGVDVKDARDARLRLRFGDLPDQQLRRAVRNGYELWLEAGMPAERYRSARLDLGEAGFADAWRYLG